MRSHFSGTTGHQRLIYGVVAGVVLAVLPIPLSPQSHGLLAWVAGAGTYLVLAWWLAIEFDAVRTRQRALAQDQPGVVLFVLVLLSVFASIVAITLMLHHLKDLSTMERVSHLTLSLAALGASWLLMHSIFAFRYAHLYYNATQDGKRYEGGLVFPGGQAPDYSDFLYYAHVVGMTSQVSDVVVTSRALRQLTLIHSICAFVFNMLVLALSINVMAGAIQGS